MPGLIIWFLRYKYLVIFPVAVVEGPIITILSGFLASLGYLHFWLIYILIVIADLLGDSLFYMLGRFGREKFIEKYGHYIGIRLNEVRGLERHFQKHKNKTLFIAKFAHGFGSIVLVAAGIARVPYKHVIRANAAPTAIKSMILMLIGYYYGQFYAKFNTYLNLAAILALLIFVIVYTFLLKTKLLSKLLSRA